MAPIQQQMPVLDVGEDPFERGETHGRVFAASVASNLETYLRRFEASGLDRDAARAEGARWLAAMQRQNADYCAEMAGIAKGSERSEAEIALLNARYELAFTLFGKDAQAREDLLSVGPDGCTTFGLLPEVAANGHTWLGQNWDWLEGVHGHCLVLRATRRHAPSFLCLTEAGIAGGKMGVNECGVGLVENGLASSRDGANPFQKPFHMRCREVLDAGRFDDALRPILDTKRTCSANFVVGHADGEIIDIETSPDHVTYLYPDGGIVTHSNHFVGTGHGESQMEKVGPSTLFRAARLKRLLAMKGGKLAPDDMQAAARDTFGAPNGICRSPDPRLPEAKRTMTAASVLIDLGARTMHVANGPPTDFAYHPVPLDPRG
ncbi:C45 family peptidase [Ancylobacter sp. MQZ15Z-1]|uniref:C45 family peptidase n=1 Tax=Ancylobacter mangrovi TaxID=2972472 RepID=A0A9X2PC81_9HYPH|nr:C45 family peptidase [Ancylobacter mangrovi]MCS0494749.1 C45 family peptidase [Ancylobacter mangrovi]